MKDKKISNSCILIKYNNKDIWLKRKITFHSISKITFTARYESLGMNIWYKSYITYTIIGVCIFKVEFRGAN